MEPAHCPAACAAKGRLARGRPRLTEARQSMTALPDANWLPPAHWLKLTAIDMHTGGEPLRVFVAGLPAIPGATVLEKRAYFRAHLDHLRTGAMWEPRGHADMYGAVLSSARDADFDVFFLHNEGYSTMCGHAIIALTTLLVETGRAGSAPAADGAIELSFNVPAGRIEARATLAAGCARDVRFRNVPSFAYLRDGLIEVPGIGSVRFDIAYGGAFYALVDATRIGLALEPGNVARIIDWGRRIKQAVAAAYPIVHPFEPELGFLYGTIFTAPAQQPDCHSRNVCVFADGEVDRSATGSGVSARAALHHARGELPLDATIRIESLLGSTMSVRAVERTRYGDYDAVIPEVGGSAHVVGRNELWFDPDDPLRAGFFLR